jgi:hypothetical protein
MLLDAHPAAVVLEETCLTAMTTLTKCESNLFHQQNHLIYLSTYHPRQRLIILPP